MTDLSKAEKLEKRNQIIEADENEKRKTTSQRLKLARVQRGLKQKELAQQLGVSEGTYSRYEKGVHAIPRERIDALGRILDVKVLWLMGQGAMAVGSDMDLEDLRSGLHRLSLAAIYGDETGNDVLDAALRSTGLIIHPGVENQEKQHEDSIFVSFRVPLNEKEELSEMASLSGLSSQDTVRLAIGVLKEILKLS